MNLKLLSVTVMMSLGLVLQSCTPQRGVFSQRLPGPPPKDCAGLKHGKSETRTRFQYEESQFDVSGNRTYHCEPDVQSRSCNNGVIGGWSGYGDAWSETECVPILKSCPRDPSNPSQIDLDHDETHQRTVFQSGSVSFGNACQSALVTDSCNDGVRTSTSNRPGNEGTDWSALSCSVGAPAGCTATDGSSIASGLEESRQRCNLASAIVRDGQSCQCEDQRRVCTNGSFSNWYIGGSNPKNFNINYPAINPSSCTYDRSCSNGQADGSDQSGEAWKKSNPTFAEGCKKVSYTLRCANGALGKFDPVFEPIESPTPSDWTNWSATGCAAQDPLSCTEQTWNSGNNSIDTVRADHDQTGTWRRFESGNVVEPGTCQYVDVTGKCSNGEWVDISYSDSSRSGYTSLTCAESDHPGCENGQFSLGAEDSQVRYERDKVNWAESCVSETQKRVCERVDDATGAMSEWSPNNFSQVSCNKTTGGLVLNYTPSQTFCFSAGFSSVQFLLTASTTVPENFIYVIRSINGNESIPNGVSINSQTGQVTIAPSTPAMVPGDYSVLVHAYPDSASYPSFPVYNPANSETFVAGTVSFKVVDCGTLFNIEFGNTTCRQPVQFTVSPSEFIGSDYTLSLEPTPSGFTISNAASTKGRIAVPANTVNQDVTIVARDSDGNEVHRVTRSLNIQDCSIGQLSYSFADLNNPRSTDSEFNVSLSGNISSASGRYFEFAQIRYRATETAAWTTGSVYLSVNSSTGKVTVSKDAPSGFYELTVQAAKSESEFSDANKRISYSGSFRIQSTVSGEFNYSSSPNQCYLPATSAFTIERLGNLPPGTSSFIRYALTREVSDNSDTDWQSRISVDSNLGHISVSSGLTHGSYRVVVRAISLDYDPSDTSTYTEAVSEFTLSPCSSIFELEYPKACPGVHDPIKLNVQSGAELSFEPTVSGIYINASNQLVTTGVASGVYNGEFVAKNSGVEVARISAQIEVLGNCGKSEAQFVWTAPNGSATEFEFPSTLIGLESEIIEFTLWNFGQTDSAIKSLQLPGLVFNLVSGHVSSEPSVPVCQVGLNLQALGGRCVVGVRFKPNSLASVFSDLSGKPVTGTLGLIRLTGKGIAGAIVKENQGSPLFGDSNSFNGSRLSLDHTYGENSDGGAMVSVLKHMQGQWTSPETYRGPAAQMNYMPLLGYQTEDSGKQTDPLSYTENSENKAMQIYVEKNPSGCGKLRVLHYRGVDPAEPGIAFDPRGGASFDAETLISASGKPLIDPVLLSKEPDDRMIFPGVNRSEIQRAGLPRVELPFFRAETDGGFDHFVSNPSDRLAYILGQYPQGLQSRPFFSGANHNLATSQWDDRNHLFHTFDIGKQVTVRDSQGNYIQLGPENVCGFVLQVSAWDDQRDRTGLIDREAINYLRLLSTVQDRINSPVLYAMRLEDIHQPYPHRLLGHATTFLNWLDRLWGGFAGTPNDARRRLYVLDSNRLPAGLYGYNYSPEIMPGIRDEVNVHLAIPGINVESVSLMVFYDDKTRPLPDAVRIEGSNSGEYCGGDGRFKIYQGGVERNLYANGVSDIEQALIDAGLLDPNTDPRFSAMVQDGFKNCQSGLTEKMSIRCEPGESLDGYIRRMKRQYEEFVARASQLKGGRDRINEDCEECGYKTVKIDCPECDLSKLENEPQSDGTRGAGMKFKSQDITYYNCDSRGLKLSIDKRWKEILGQVGCKNAKFVSSTDSEISPTTMPERNKTKYESLFGYKENGTWKETPDSIDSTHQISEARCKCTPKDSVSSISRWTKNTCADKGQKCTLSYPVKYSCETVSVLNGVLMPTKFSYGDGANSTVTGNSPCPASVDGSTVEEKMSNFVNSESPKLYLEPICTDCSKYRAPPPITKFRDACPVISKQYRKVCNESRKKSEIIDGREVQSLVDEWDPIDPKNDTSFTKSTAPSCCPDAPNDERSMSVPGTFWVFVNPSTGGWGSSGTGAPGDSEPDLGSGCWKQVSCTGKEACSDTPPPAVWNPAGDFEFTLSPAQDPIDPLVRGAIQIACQQLKSGQIPPIPDQIQTAPPPLEKRCGFKGLCDNGALNPPKCDVCPIGYFMSGGKCIKSVGTGGKLGGHHEGPVNINGGSSGWVPSYP